MSTARRAPFTLALLASALLGASSVRAQPAPRPVRLVYTGADGCPAEPGLRAAVVARLGRDPFRDDALRTLTAAVRRTSRGLRAAVELREAGGAVVGARRLSTADDDCDELVAALALAISIAIDPQSRLRPTATPPLAPPPAPPPQAGAPPAQPPPPPALLEPPIVEPPIALPLPAALPSPAPASPWRFRLRGGAHVPFGLLPGSTGGLSLDLGARRGAFSLTLGAEADLPTTRAADAGGEVRAWLVAARLAPCLHLGAAAICGLASLGSLRGSGSGVALPRTDVTIFAALGARIAAEIPITSRLALAPHADLAVPLTHTTLQLAGADVWSTPAAHGAMGLAAVAHFP